MEFIKDDRSSSSELTELFTETFSTSEGPEEGRAIGALVADLLATTPEGDLQVFVARSADRLAGAVLATRLRYAGEDREVMMLAPVAVHPDFQRRGIGQTLLRKTLEMLRTDGTDVAVTYGDPGYYSRVGFQQVSTDTLPAPQPLSQPIGWLAQPLTAVPLAPLRGPARCVPAFDTQEFW